MVLSIHLQKVEEIDRHRDIVHIYNNIWDMDLYRDCYIDDKERKFKVAKVDGHGKSFAWYL